MWGGSLSFLEDEDKASSKNQVIIWLANLERYFFGLHNWAFYSNLESIYPNHLFVNICNYSMYCQNNMAPKSLAVLETSEVVEYLREAVFQVKLAFL